MASIKRYRRLSSDVGVQSDRNGQYLGGIFDAFSRIYSTCRSDYYHDFGVWGGCVGMVASDRVFKGSVG